MTCKIKKLDSEAKLPAYKTDMSAGADICSLTNVLIPKGETVKVRTGISIEPSERCVVLLYIRSGTALKKNLSLANGVGVIDCDYRGEILLAVHNNGQTDQIIESGERVAQLIFTQFETAQFVEADDISETLRGSGGFGSTGSK